MSTVEKALQAISLVDHEDPSAVQCAALQMEDFLLAEPVAQAKDLSQQLGQSVITATTGIYERFETNLENDFADRFLRDEVAAEDYPLYERFQRLVAKEVEGADIQADDRVLFIGSGPFPISPILTHELSGGAPVDCFDLSDEACEVSRKVLRKLGLDQEITVANVTAENAELPTTRSTGEMGAYSAVIVALLAQPKSEILQRIWRSVGPVPRIILRNSEGNRRLIYAGMDPAMLETDHFVRINSYHAGVDDTISGDVLRTGRQPHLFKM